MDIGVYNCFGITCRKLAGIRRLLDMESFSFPWSWRWFSFCCCSSTGVAASYVEGAKSMFGLILRCISPCKWIFNLTFSMWQDKWHAIPSRVCYNDMQFFCFALWIVVLASPLAATPWKGFRWCGTVHCFLSSTVWLDNAWKLYLSEIPRLWKCWFLFYHLFLTDSNAKSQPES